MEDLTAFLHQQNIAYLSIEPLALSGGDRQYYRVHCNNQNYIATISEDIKENKTFFSFTHSFAKLGLPVPLLIAISHDQNIYLQQDLGKNCLLDKILTDGLTEENLQLYQQAIEHLATINIQGHAVIDYTLCLVNEQFDAKAALFDLQYCMQYFVSHTSIAFDASALEKDFIALSNVIGGIQPVYFMYRDCQGRNIMVQDDQIFFIDYQGGMRGPLGYDVASLLWQAKAQLPADWKQSLLQLYMQSANKLLPTPINEKLFTKQYYLIVLMRLLQVLGAYGRRGLQEGKAHFIDSIPQGIANLKEWQQLMDISKTYPALHQLMNDIIAIQSTFQKK
jgi:aminoglycoside/choline kinase family phosphotransferase